MKSLKILILLIASSISYASPVPRVVGGFDAHPHEFPYQISILFNGRHNCGGSILNKDYILTAAHCARPANETIIIAGGHNLVQFDGNEQVRNIYGFINHEKYEDGVGPYDIALIKVTEPFEFNDFVQPIALPLTAEEYPEGNGILTGWGSISRDLRPVYPDILQKAVMPIHSQDLCSRIWTLQPYHFTNLCSGELNADNAVCSGDSGGPLAQKTENNETVIVGIVSWGPIPCGTPGKPGVFTNVSYFIDWILNKME